VTFRSCRADHTIQGQSRGKEDTMREYELAFIISPELDDTATQDSVDKIKGWITDAGGTIEKMDAVGRQKLAYLIRNQKEGQYYILDIKMNPEEIAPLERRFRLEEPVMRFLIIRKDE
jgi:small subunit ribosomal protein S6